MKRKKGVNALITIIVIFTVIFGGGVGVMATFRAIALQQDHFGTPSAEVYDETKPIDPATFVTVEKKEGKKFVILNISDTHLSDYDYRLFTGALALRDIKRLVKEVKPDLITLSGDLVCARSQYNSARKLTDFMNSLKIYWAPVFGNHDGEASNIDVDAIAEIYMGKPGKDNYCLMRKGPGNLGDGEGRERVGNYVVNIVEKDASNGGNGKLVHSLFMMDTANSQLTAGQIAWYKSNVAALKTLYPQSVKSESTLVVHIPLAQYSYAYMEGFNEKTRKWNAEFAAAGAYGDCHEDICCNKKNFSSLAEMAASEEYNALPEKYKEKKYQDYLKKHGVPIENGAFAAIKEMGHTKTVVCGHDHINCFFVPYQGVNLIYSLKNGMGSGYLVGRSGGTVLTVAYGSTEVTQRYL